MALLGVRRGLGGQRGRLLAAGPRPAHQEALAGLQGAEPDRSGSTAHHRDASGGGIE